MSQSTTIETLAAKVAALEAAAPRPRAPRPYYSRVPLAADLDKHSLVARYDEDVSKRTPPTLVTECRVCGCRLRPDVELPAATLDEARASVPVDLEVLKCPQCQRYGEAAVTVRPGSRFFTVPVPAKIEPCSWCKRDVALHHERTPEQDRDDALYGRRWAGPLCGPCWQAHHLGHDGPADLPETNRPAELLDSATRFDRVIDGRGIEPSKHERITEDRTVRKRAGTL